MLSEALTMYLEEGIPQNPVNEVYLSKFTPAIVLKREFGVQFSEEEVKQSLAAFDGAIDDPIEFWTLVCAANFHKAAKAFRMRANDFDISNPKDIDCIRLSLCRILSECQNAEIGLHSILSVTSDCLDSMSEEQIKELLKILKRESTQKKVTSDLT